MRFGRFEAHVFQDLIHKGYIIALAFGNISRRRTLYTRVHSSCVTSETMLGCDCDCVQQLEGALQIIARRGHGILFYLMQEGRGVGYVAKARDRMLVQASGDRLNTFEAYHMMGLRKDYRNYEDVAHVCHQLGVKAAFVVLTNNPDKIAAMRRAGLKVAGAEALEFEPSPFNLAYLTSKAASGHRLSRPGLSRELLARPPGVVEPFTPHVVTGAERFIYAASYYLPVKPVDNEIVLNEPDFLPLRDAIAGGMQGDGAVIEDYHLIRGNRFIVRIHGDRLQRLRESQLEHPLAPLLTTPYWFRVHVYFDLVTSQEFVVLTYGEPAISDLPVLRLQSESLFNRLPLASMDNREKFKRSLHHIVHYGVGAVVLLYFDGRGAGFGAHAVDRMLTERNAALSSDEAYRMLGVEYDSRDYDACLLLLKQHLRGTKVQMIMNSPSSLVRKTEYAAALNKHRIEVEKWIFLDESKVSD